MFIFEPHRWCFVQCLHFASNFDGESGKGTLRTRAHQFDLLAMRPVQHRERHHHARGLVVPLGVVRKAAILLGLVLLIQQALHLATADHHALRQGTPAAAAMGIAKQPDMAAQVCHREAKFLFTDWKV